MDCQEFEKNIQPFIDKKLEYRQLNDFLKHFEECKECHEEMEINFLMAYVLQNEDHISFNLSDELGNHIQAGILGKKKFYRQTILQWVLVSVTNITAALALISYILLFLL